MSYMHHTVQRGTNINDYAIAGTDFGVITPWSILYSRALQDLEELLAQGEAEEAWHYVGVAEIQKAYIYSILVDVYGDVPFAEANKSSEFPSPEYDLGENIYPALFGLIDSGIGHLAMASTLSPAGDDLFYAGNLASWRKFANTLSVKMYNQVRLVQNVSGEVNALISGGDLISGPGENFQLVHGNTLAPDDRNPGFVQEWAASNPQYYVSPYLYETMANLNTFDHRNYGGNYGISDPRIPYYFYNSLPVGAVDDDAENPCAYCPSRSGTSYLSIWMFSFNIDPNEGFDQATSQTVSGLYPMGGRFDDGTGGTVNGNVGNPGAVQRLLTYADRKFIEAELFETGTASGDARTTLEEAIRASFTQVNLAAASGGASAINSADVDNYTSRILQTYDMADSVGTSRLEIIMTQKWIGTFGWGVDAFTDFRRTGFPELHDGNTDNLATTIRTREFPNAFPWPTAQLSLNPNAPAQKNVVDPSSKPFWMP